VTCILDSLTNHDDT